MQEELEKEASTTWQSKKFVLVSGRRSHTDGDAGIFGLLAANEPKGRAATLALRGHYL